ncbi:hypothetical protein [Microbacterium sp. GXF6406]
MPETSDAFTTVEALALRTGRTFPDEQKPQIVALLEDASEHLRGVVGSQVSPPKTYVVTLPAGAHYLPAFTTEVASVVRNGEPVGGYSFDGAELLIPGTSPATVTFVCGIEDAPKELQRWAIVLVAQTLSTIELGLGLSAGGLSSVSIDDFKAAFADGGASTGMALNDRSVESIRDRFGYSGGVYTVDLRNP